MAKLSLTDVTATQNQTSLAATINSNHTKLEAALEKTLSRDGTSPNSMEADLDMNSMRIMNLPEAESNSEPFTYGQAQEILNLADDFNESIATVASYAASALDSKLSAEAAAAAAETAAAGAGVTDGDKGDIVVSGSGVAWTTEKASQAEAEAGTDAAKVMTAVRVAQSISARSPTAPRNTFLAAFFRTDADTTLDLYDSPDGITFTKFTTGGLPEGNTTGQLAGRDAKLTYFNGWWLAAVTGLSAGSYDFVVLRSRDLVLWERVECKLGTTAVASATVAMPGGSVPADKIWAPSWFVSPEGDLHVVVSIRYGADFTDVNGSTIPDFVAYYAKCTDVDALSFNSPVKFPLSGTPGQKIDMSVYLVGSTWNAVVKNEYSKNIEIWTCSTWNGTYTLSQTLNFSVDVEAPCMAPYYYGTGSSPSGVTYRIYADAYYTGFYRYMVSSDFSTWSGETTVKSDYSMRHGSVINLVDAPEAAWRSYIAAKTTISPAAGRTPLASVRLAAGSTTLDPVDDTLYYVLADDVCNLTLRRAGRRFWLAVLSGSTAAGINLVSDSMFPAAGVSLGFGRDNDSLFEVVASNAYSSAWQYYLVSGRSIKNARFKAHKNGTDQTGIASATSTKITMGTTSLNDGGCFDTSNSRVIPPSGSRMYLHATLMLIAGSVDQQNIQPSIKKNGSLFAQEVRSASGTGVQSASVACMTDVGNGSDYYEVWYEGAGTGTKTVSGAATNSWFEGFSV